MKKHPHLRSSRRTAALILAGSVAALLVPRLSAQTTITYTNGQNDATAYSTSAPNDPTTLSLASGAATQSGILSGNGRVFINAGTGTLTLSAANTVSGTTTVSAGTLVLGNVNALQNSTLNMGVDGTQAVFLTVAGINTFNLGGLTGADLLNLSYNTISVGANNASTTFSGRLGGQGGGLTKVGAGTLTLSGSNLQTGVTTFREGILSVATIGNGGNLGNAPITAAYLVFDGGTLRYTGATATTNRNFTINAGKTATFNITSSATNLTWTGASIATNGALTKTGAGTLTLTGANLHTGATTVSAGTLAEGSTGSIADTSNLTVNGATAIFDLGANHSDTVGTVTLQGGASITGSGSSTLTANTGQTFEMQSGSASVILAGSGIALNKTTGGTVTLSGANTYTGGTTVNAGTLLLSGANNMPATGTLLVNAGGNFSLADGTARATTTTAALNLASGANLTFDWNAGAVDTLTSTAAATTTGIVGIIINPTNAPTGTGLTLLSSSSGGLQTAGGTKYYLANNTNFTVTLAQSDTAVTIGSYTAVSAPATFYWQGNLVAGTNTAGADNALAYSNGSASNWSSTQGSYTATGVVPGSSANVIFSAAGAVEQSTVLGADMAVNTVTFNNSAAVAIGGGNTLTLMSTGTGASSAIVVSATANANTAISSNVALGASQTWSVASGKNLAVSGTVSGGNSLTKADDGTVTLSGANTYTGATRISAGTLSVGSIGNGGASGNLGASTNAAANLVFDGGTLRFTGLTASTDRNFTINAGKTATFDITTNNLTVSGRSTATTGALTKTGAGTLTLSGANLHTGDTTVNQGTLALGNVNAIANSTLDTGASGAQEVTFTAAGTNTYNVGGLKGADALAIGANTLSVGANGQNTSYDGVLSGSTGALTKTGAGTLTLTGANTYTGATTISTGTLSVGSIGDGGVSGNLGAASTAAANLVFDGGTLQYTGATESTDRNFTINAGKTATFDITTNNLTVSGASTATNGALTKTGAGTLTLSGANLHSGNTTVRAGTLKLDLSGSISNSAAIIVGDAGSSGARLDVTTVNGGFVVVINQTLKGIGTIDGSTTILGTHAPGNSPGLQTVNGNLIYGTGSMVNLELGSNLSSDTAGIRGVHFDAVDVTGALTIGTGVTSNLIFNGVGSAVDFADAFWTSDRSWLVYDAATLSSGSIFDTITATVDSLGGTLPASAFSWQQTGNDVFLKFTAPGGPNPVPEPTGVAVGLLCVGVAAFRRRRSAAVAAKLTA